ncbi:hypothetical protein CPB85DRAFT_1322874 [Mucidula mucida]|nr:hypothetical protein CPB85DRAFT_1322874 [Mucidula mucida]
MAVRVKMAIHQEFFIQAADKSEVGVALESSYHLAVITLVHCTTIPRFVCGNKLPVACHRKVNLPPEAKEHKANGTDISAGKGSQFALGDVIVSDSDAPT